MYSGRTGDTPPMAYVGRKIVCENKCRKTYRKNRRNVYRNTIEKYIEEHIETP
jgi:hypothetical protein